jgi:predicted Zn-dependent protease
MMRIFILLSIFTSCSYLSVKQQKENVVVFDQDVVVYENGTKETKIKKGEKVSLKSGFLYVQKPFYKDFYLYMLPEERAGEIKVSLIRDGKKYDSQSLQATNQVFPEIFKTLGNIEELVSENELRQAAATMKVLVEKYPELSYLKVIYANILIKAGEKSLAQTQLDAAINDFPEDQELKDLRKKLEENNIRELSSEE